MNRFSRGAAVIFQARTGKKFSGIVKGFPRTGKILVLLGDDPFPVEVDVNKLIPKEYIDTMTTKSKAEKATTKRPAKAAAAPARTRRTRTAAAEAPVEDDVADVAPAKRTAKKAAAKKVAAPRTAKAASGPNPYRPGSNMFKITELLLQGGKRSAIVKKLTRQIDIHPYTQDKDTLDVEKELDKRVTLTAQTLARQLGYTVQKEGRGMETGTIKVIPPAA